MALPIDGAGGTLEEAGPPLDATSRPRASGAGLARQPGAPEILIVQQSETPLPVSPTEVAPSLASLAPRRSSLAPFSAAPIGTSDHIASNAETLRQVMRAIATIHPSDNQPAQTRVPSSIDPYLYEGLSASQAADYVSELILDSEIAGAVLRAVTDIKSTDGQFTVFSVLGMGAFVLDVSPGGHSLTISELSNGWSATLSGKGGASYMEYAVSGVGEGGASVEKPNNFRLALNWLREIFLNPLALLLELIVGLLLMLWIAARSVYHLQQRDSRSRR